MKVVQSWWIGKLTPQKTEFSKAGRQRNVCIKHWKRPLRAEWRKRCFARAGQKARVRTMVKTSTWASQMRRRTLAICGSPTYRSNCHAVFLRLTIAPVLHLNFASTLHLHKIWLLAFQSFGFLCYSCTPWFILESLYYTTVFLCGCVCVAGSHAAI